PIDEDSMAALWIVSSRRPGAWYALFSLAVLACAMATPAQAAPVQTLLRGWTLNPVDVDGWNFESQALRDPVVPCDDNHTAHNPANYLPPNTAWLNVETFSTSNTSYVPFTLAANDEITKVEVDVDAGHDGPGSGTSTIRVQVHGSTVTSANVNTVIGSGSMLACNWQLTQDYGGSGWPVTGQLTSLTAAAVNGMEVR